VANSIREDCERGIEGKVSNRKYSNCSVVRSEEDRRGKTVGFTHKKAGIL